MDVTPVVTLTVSQILRRDRRVTRVSKEVADQSVQRRGES
jgi:hypothetical protein